jgi:hypothetical protein
VRVDFGLTFVRLVLRLQRKLLLAGSIIVCPKLIDLIGVLVWSSWLELAHLQGYNNLLQVLLYSYDEYSYYPIYHDRFMFFQPSFVSYSLLIPNVIPTRSVNLSLISKSRNVAGDKGSFWVNDLSSDFD